MIYNHDLFKRSCFVSHALYNSVTLPAHLLRAYNVTIKTGTKTRQNRKSYIGMNWGQHSANSQETAGVSMNHPDPLGNWLPGSTCSNLLGFEDFRCLTHVAMHTHLQTFPPLSQFRLTAHACWLWINRSRHTYRWHVHVMTPYRSCWEISTEKIDVCLFMQLAPCYT